jgi:hypothetical protein
MRRNGVAVGRDQFEPKHIMIKVERRRHIEDLQQWGHPANIDGHAKSS